VSIALALVAALLVGAGLVLQQHAAAQEPGSYFLHLRLITDLLRRRRWLAGIAITTCGWILQAWVFGNIDLSIAEPLLASNLIFALIVAIPLTGERPRRSEIIGALLLAAGVAALSVSRSVQSESLHFGGTAYWPAAAGVAAIAFLFVRAGWKRSGQQRATLTGAASGLIFGISDALTRRTLQIVSGHGVVAVLTSWPAYSLAGAVLLALWLMQSAFSAAPLHASLPAITAGEPVVGILLGVIVFGDVIRISPGLLAVQAIGITALLAGVVLVARAPVLGGIKPVTQQLREHLPGQHPGHDGVPREHGHEAVAPVPPEDGPAVKPEREEV
jgi:drug/metabolite transporter (DMT)-like permease